MAEETTATEQVTTARGLSVGKLIGVVAVVAILAGAGYYAMNRGGSAVAIVNGQKISMGEYSARYALLAASVAAQGQSATTTEMQNTIKAQTIDNIVTETMLLQAAAKEGIKADDKVVSDLFEQNKKQFADNAAFEKALTTQGYTDTTFKEYLTRTNIIQQYLAKHLDVTTLKATDAEVNALYAQVAANNKSVPPLKEVRTQVENQILQQKQQQLISTYITQLRASSTISILLK